MQSDPFAPEPTIDPQDSAAVIHPVTPEQLDEAAHKAAQLADGVAHHTIAATGTGHEPADEVRTVAETGDETIGPAETAVDTAVADLVGSTSDQVHKAAVEIVEPVAEAVSASRTAPAATLALYNGKVLEVVQSNLTATTALFAALTEAKSLPEAMAINSDHLRRRLDTLTTQGRELANLAQKLSLDAWTPLAGLFGRRG